MINNVFLQHNTQIIRLIYLDISQLFTKEDKSYFVWPFGGALDINYGQSNNLTLVGQLLIFMAQFPKPEWELPQLQDSQFYYIRAFHPIENMALPQKRGAADVASITSFCRRLIRNCHLFPTYLSQMSHVCTSCRIEGGKWDKCYSFQPISPPSTSFSFSSTGCATKQT